jgi:hypothetical protein
MFRARILGSLVGPNLAEAAPLLGTNWALTGTMTWTHTGGAAGSISWQSLTLVPGATYQAIYTMSAMTTGSLQPNLQGGTAVNGTLRSTNATFTENIVPLVGNNTFRFTSSVGYDGILSLVSFRRIA